MQRKFIDVAFNRTYSIWDFVALVYFRVSFLSRFLFALRQNFNPFESSLMIVGTIDVNNFL